MFVEPQPRALGELERGWESDQLLGDGVVAYRFRTPAGDVAVDVRCSQVGEKEWLVLAVVHSGRGGRTMGRGVAGPQSANGGNREWEDRPDESSITSEIGWWRGSPLAMLSLDGHSE